MVAVLWVDSFIVCHLQQMHHHALQLCYELIHTDDKQEVIDVVKTDNELHDTDEIHNLTPTSAPLRRFRHCGFKDRS